MSARLEETIASVLESEEVGGIGMVPWNDLTRPGRGATSFHEMASRFHGPCPVIRERFPSIIVTRLTTGSLDLVHVSERFDCADR